MSHAAALADLIASPECRYFEQLTARYHFTVNERIQLKNLLSRWNVITDKRSLEFDETGLHSGNDVLRWLDLRINNIDFNL